MRRTPEDLERGEHVPGQLTVDDVLDTRPRVLSLFSGYGGLDAAAVDVLGGRVVAHAEIEPAACRVLAHHFPHVPNLGDVTGVDWATVGPVDVLTGGFPCQDVSLAGRRLGIRHDTRSGLWAQVAAAVDVLRPRLVLIENVRGLLSARAHHPAHTDSDLAPCPWCLERPDDVPLRALGAVLGDLADLGYDAAWQLLRASDVGAPHERARVFVLAWPRRAPADPADVGRERSRRARGRPGGPADGGRATAADPGRAGSPHGVPRRSASAGQAGVGAAERRRAGARDAVPWGPYGPAVRRWEAVLGRPAPAPHDPGRAGPRLSPRFVEWLMGLPDGHVTDVPGLTRTDMLRVLGNGVVPQQAATALRLLLPDADTAATPDASASGVA